MDLFLFFAFRSASLIILEEFGVVFDMVLDKLDEPFFEERVVVLDPGGQGVLLLQKRCDFRVACFLQEERDQMEDFF